MPTPPQCFPPGPPDGCSTQKRLLAPQDQLAMGGVGGGGGGGGGSFWAPFASAMKSPCAIGPLLSQGVCCLLRTRLPHRASWTTRAVRARARSREWRLLSPRSAPRSSSSQRRPPTRPRRRTPRRRCSPSSGSPAAAPPRRATQPRCRGAGWPPRRSAARAATPPRSARCRRRRWACAQTRRSRGGQRWRRGGTTLAPCRRQEG